MDFGAHAARDGKRRAKPSRMPIREVAAALKADAEAVARELLGAPNAKLSNKETLRYSNNGVLRMHISGPRKGGPGSMRAAAILAPRTCSRGRSVRRARAPTNGGGSGEVFWAMGLMPRLA